MIATRDPPVEALATDADVGDDNTLLDSTDGAPPDKDGDALGAVGGAVVGDAVIVVIAVGAVVGDAVIVVTEAPPTACSEKASQRMC